MFILIRAEKSKSLALIISKLFKKKFLECGCGFGCEINDECHCRRPPANLDHPMLRSGCVGLHCRPTNGTAANRKDLP